MMLYIPHPFRYCYKCAQYKPYNEFPKNRSKKDKLGTECHVCCRKRARKWANEHPEEAAEGKRLYVLRNPERRHKSIMDYVANHRDAVCERNRQYRLANLDMCRRKSNERAKRYYREHREEILPKRREQAKHWRKVNPDWYSRNPGRYSTYWSKRQARKKGLPDAFTADDWLRALDYFAIDGVHCCAVCGRPAGLWHTLAQDHWIPLNNLDCTGTIPSNIVPLCHGEGGCNNSKAARNPVEWLTERFGKQRAAQILKRINAYFEWVKMQG